MPNTNLLTKVVKYGLIQRHFYYLTNNFRVLPNCIVIGVGRSGTTSLFNYLAQHSCISKSAYDEIGFFDDNFHLGLDWYRSMFPTKLQKKKIEKKHGHFLTYEVTPWYIRRPWVAKRIHKLLPHVKIIAVLRNPTDRTYSHYHLSVRAGIMNCSFEELIKSDMENLEKNIFEPNDEKNYFTNVVQSSYLARGFYAEQLDYWYDLFPKNQIHLVSSEQLSVNTQETLNEIFKFLELPIEDIQNLEKTSVGNYSKMNPKTRKNLIDYFEPYNKKLYDLTQTNFHWDE